MDLLHEGPKCLDRSSSEDACHHGADARVESGQTPKAALPRSEVSDTGWTEGDKGATVDECLLSLAASTSPSLLATKGSLRNSEVLVRCTACGRDSM